MVVGRYMDRIRAIEPLRTTPAGTVFWDIQMLGLRGPRRQEKFGRSCLKRELYLLRRIRSMR